MSALAQADDPLTWSAFDVGQLDADDLLTLQVRHGRNEKPVIIHHLWVEGLLTSEAISAGVPGAWSSCEHPERSSGVDRETWFAMFRDAGFTIDGKIADRPTGHVTVYRGCVPARRRGIAWTADPDRAAWFARRFDVLGQLGSVYRVTAPWTAVLAVINTRNEHEHVIDTRRLKITMHEAGGERE